MVGFQIIHGVPRLGFPMMGLTEIRLCCGIVSPDSACELNLQSLEPLGFGRINRGPKQVAVGLEKVGERKHEGRSCSLLL